MEDSLIVVHTILGASLYTPLAILASCLAVGTIGLCVYLAPQLTRLTWTRHVLRRCKERKALVLTYDDGPSASITPRLLDLLESHHARATFYCMGKHAELYTELVQRIAHNGHEIASHSHDHHHAWHSMPWTVVRDVTKGFRTMASINLAGQSQGLRFRPTYGKLTLASLLVARHWHAPIDWWTINSGDTFACPPTSKTTLAKLESQSGGVILLHDFERESPEREDYVLEMTDQLCKRGHELGLTLMTMSELMDDSGA